MKACYRRGTVVEGAPCTYRVHAEHMRSTWCRHEARMTRAACACTCHMHTSHAQCTCGGHGTRPGEDVGLGLGLGLGLGSGLGLGLGCLGEEVAERLEAVRAEEPVVLHHHHVLRRRLHVEDGVDRRDQVTALPLHLECTIGLQPHDRVAAWSGAASAAERCKPREPQCLPGPRAAPRLHCGVTSGPSRPPGARHQADGGQGMAGHGMARHGTAWHWQGRASAGHGRAL